MKHVFHLGRPIRVPDGTLVRSAFAGGRGEADLSIAVGEIEPHSVSKIHLHPLVAQVAWVLSGALTVRMKDASAREPYTLTLAVDESVVTAPRTFFQLVNDTGALCRVLYIVQPAFLFVVDSTGHVIYNDAVIFDEDWAALAAAGWPRPDPAPLRATRARLTAHSP